MSYQVSLFYTMYLYNVHYWISFPHARYPFSFQPFMPIPSLLFIQVKLDTAPYEPSFTAADKKELQPKSSFPPSQGAFLKRHQCPIRPIINIAPNAFSPYQIPELRSRQRKFAVHRYDHQRLLKSWTCQKNRGHFDFLTSFHLINDGKISHLCP